MGGKKRGSEHSHDTFAEYLTPVKLTSMWSKNQAVQQGPKDIQRRPQEASEHDFTVLSWLA